MCSFFTNTQIPYALLLEKREWLSKKQQIICRDGGRCTSCGRIESEDVHLQVHHKYYIAGLDPWEYNDSVLITLCEDCHRVVHEFHVIRSYERRGEDLVEIQRTPCERCNGLGYFSEYNHIQKGICFRCFGERYEQSIDSVLDYLNNHDITLSEFQDGFEELSLEQYANISKAEVIANSTNEDRLKVRIMFKNGILVEWPLDYSVIASPGDQLRIKSLRVKQCSSHNRKLLVFKGEVI